MPGFSQDEFSFDEPPTISDGVNSRGLSRIFLGWEEPLVELATVHLTRDWNRTGPLDLSDHLIIVPTRHAGRRLRERLAIFADESASTAALPPLVVTPDFLISPNLCSGENPVASSSQTLIGMVDILQRLDLGHYRRLFPVDPVEQNFNWSLKTANDLLRMRSLLSEAGLTVVDAAQILSENEREPERWRDITRIDQQLTEQLVSVGLTDRSQAQREAAENGTLPPEIRSISVIGEPDLPSLVVAALRRHARTIPVEILVYAPPNFASMFDAEGRPVIPSWTDREIPLPDAEKRVHPATEPAHQAERTLEILAGYDESPAGSLAIGVPDPEIISPLEKSLATRGWGTFDPGGKRLATHGIFYLLRVLQQLIATRSYAAFSDLLRIPGVMDSLRTSIDSAPSATELLTTFDALGARHLPDTIEDAITAAGRNARREPLAPLALAWCEDWLRRFTSEPFDIALTEFLGKIYAGREFQPNRAEDSTVATVADLIHRTLDEFEGPVTDQIRHKLGATDQLELLLQVLDDQVYYPERSTVDIDLQGWLELLWEDAPHLVLTGMNDGRVPETIIGHPFLPDSARVLLGLRHNEARLARDAYLLTALTEMRQSVVGGRIDFVFGRTSQSGDPLRPSRLLFCCSDEALPERTLQLFDAPTPDVGIAPWELAFPLRPAPLASDAKILHRLSVTNFRAYLACPFRFYLRYGMGMEKVEAVGSEMNARAFGNLLHNVLEQFARDSTASVSENAEEIRDFFIETLERFTYGIYGNRLTVPLTIQLESARQRLSWWAEQEAEQRRTGWQILKAESPIGDRENDAPFTLAGHEINGTVDRVERHAESGVIRLLDFKTGRRKSAEEAHLAKIKWTENVEDFPAWALTTGADGKNARWIDLQLPLYQLAMQREFPEAEIEVGYVTLARAKNEIGLDLWQALTSEHLADAEHCATGVITAIQDQIFWPPTERVTYDQDFGELFFGDAETAVDPTQLLAKEQA